MKDKVIETTEIMTDSEIFCPDRESRIAELAYYKAESRGFEPGRELEDWLEAEQDCSLLN